MADANSKGSAALPDGHAHEALWSAQSVDARVKRIPRSKPKELRLGALVQRVEVTSDRAGSAEAFRSWLLERIAEEYVPSTSDILNTPFVLIGSEAQIVDQLRKHQLRWGFSRYTIRDTDMAQVANVVRDLV